MFGTGHPQPPHRKEVAMQIVQQESKAFASHELVIDMPDDSRIAAPPPGLPLRFSVSCSLAEYLSMVREHIGFMLRHEAPAVRQRRIVQPLALGAAASTAAAVLALASGPNWAALLLALAGMAFASLPLAVGFWTLLLATPVFYLKRRRMPVAEFVIDAQAIERTTKGGVQRRTWADVTQVRRYSRGYLLMFRRGGVPIPFRCLSGEQLERFRALVLARPAAA